MDITKAMQERYSCRAYKTDDVDNDLIVQCLECARLAPSACNKQPWKFYVTKGELKEKIAKETQLFGANEHTKNCPVIVVVTAKPRILEKLADKIKDQDFSSMDLGIAVHSFCLKATELGLGSCIIGWVNAKNVDKLIGTAIGEHTKLVISLGYPDDTKKFFKRKSLEEMSEFRN